MIGDPCREERIRAKGVILGLVSLALVYYRATPGA